MIASAAWIRGRHSRGFMSSLLSRDYPGGDLLFSSNKKPAGAYSDFAERFQHISPTLKYAIIRHFYPEQDARDLENYFRRREMQAEIPEIPRHEVAVPLREFTVPFRKVAVPLKEVAVPVREVAVPVREVAVPAGWYKEERSQARRTEAPPAKFVRFLPAADESRQPVRRGLNLDFVAPRTEQRQNDLTRMVERVPQRRYRVQVKELVQPRRPVREIIIHEV
eukprot:73539-Hanusia_phi.AAC.1